jgi:hypothetical protein
MTDQPVTLKDGLAISGGTGATLTAAGALAVGNLTVSTGSGPYVSNLLGAAGVPTPPGVINAKVWDYGGAAYNVKGFNVKGDGQTVSDGVMNGTTGVLTSASGKFVSGDVGKQILVIGAGAAAANGNCLSTTIASFQSATQVTTTAVSQAAVGAAIVVWGTDDSALLQVAANVSGSSRLIFPDLIYMLTTSIHPSVDGTNWEGLTTGGTVTQGSNTGGVVLQPTASASTTIDFTGRRWCHIAHLKINQINPTNPYQAVLFGPGAWWNRLDNVVAFDLANAFTGTSGFAFAPNSVTGVYWNMLIKCYSQGFGYGYDLNVTAQGTQKANNNIFVSCHGSANNVSWGIGGAAGGAIGNQIVAGNIEGYVTWGIDVGATGWGNVVRSAYFEGFAGSTGPVRFQTGSANNDFDGLTLAGTLGLNTILDLGTHNKWSTTIAVPSVETVQKSQRVEGRVMTIKPESQASETLQVMDSAGVTFFDLSCDSSNRRLDLPNLGNGGLAVYPDNFLTVGARLTGGGLATVYGTIATQGMGLPAIYRAPAPLANQTALVASFATITSPNDGVNHMYEISIGILITTLGSGNINGQVAYTDTNFAGRTTNIPLCAQAGTWAATAATADDYKGTVTITVAPNTAVTIKTAGTFTGCTYNLSGAIKQIL